MKTKIETDHNISMENSK